jgi:hypothetical protein
MATKNIVPRATGEGELGTSAKKWSKVQAVTGAFDHIQTTTLASQIYTSGSTKFGDTSDDLHQFTGSVEVTGVLTASAVRVAGSSHFGSELTDTHIFTGSFHQTGSGATSIFKDKINIQDSGLSVYTAGTTTKDKVSLTTYNFSVSDQAEDLVYRIQNNGEHTFYNNGNTRFTIDSNGASTTQNISASGHISSSAFIGDGTGLTGVTGEWDGSHTGDALISGSLSVTGTVSVEGNITGATNLYIDKIALNDSTSVDYIHYNNGFYYKGGGQFVGPLTASVLTASSATTANMSASTGYALVGDDGTTSASFGHLGSGVTIGNTANSIGLMSMGSQAFLSNNSATLNVNSNDVNLTPNTGGGGKVAVAGNLSASLGITGSEVHATEIYGSNYHEPGVLTPTYSINSTGMFIYNDITVGINSEPDTFVVDRDAKKVGVNCDIADLPDANFSVSGSTALGNLVTDTHIITGSTEIYVEAQTGLQVLQNVASSGYPLARFENTNAGGSTYIETHGVNQGGLKMYRGGTLRATIDTAGNAFTMYAGSPIPANLGFMISSGKAEFKETTAHNFAGTKGQVNISASSGPAIRIDSVAAGTSFKVEDKTTTVIDLSSSGQVYGSGYNNGQKTADFTIDWDNGNNQIVSVSGAAATGLTASFSNIKPWATYQLIYQVDKASMELYLSQSIFWPGGTRPTLSNTSGSRDILTFTTDADSNMYAVAQFNFSASVG